MHKQNALFQYFSDTFDRLIETDKKEGKYDMGILGEGHSGGGVSPRPGRAGNGPGSPWNPLAPHPCHPPERLRPAGPAHWQHATGGLGGAGPGAAWRAQGDEALSAVLYLGGHRAPFPGVPQGLERFI